MTDEGATPDASRRALRNTVRLLIALGLLGLTCVVFAFWALGIDPYLLSAFGDGTARDTGRTATRLSVRLEASAPDGNYQIQFSEADDRRFRFTDQVALAYDGEFLVDIELDLDATTFERLCLEDDAPVVEDRSGQVGVVPAGTCLIESGEPARVEVTLEGE